MKKLLSFLILLFFSSISTIAKGVANGQRFDLTTELQLNQNQFAQVFIPNYFKSPEDGKFTLVFHLHSASWAAEDLVYKAQVNAVLFNIHPGALSRPYQNYFQDSDKLRLILDKVVAEIGAQKSTCDTGYFHLKGYAGETASDHLRHLYGMHLMLAKIIQILAQGFISNDR